MVGMILTMSHLDLQVSPPHDLSVQPKLAFSWEWYPTTRTL